MILMFCCLLVSCSFNQNNKTAQLWEAYQSALQNEDDNVCYQILHQLIDLDSLNFEAKDSLAKRYYVEENYNGIYKLFQDSISNTKQSIKMYGEALLKLRKAEEATKFLQTMVGSGKIEDLSLQFNLVSLLKKKEDKQGALGVLSKMVSNKKSISAYLQVPDGKGGRQRVSYYGAAHNTAGIIYFEEGSLKLTAFHFKEALKSDPNFESPRVNMEKIREAVSYEE